MARLPIPGKDNGTWGDVLNEFLTQSHTTDGFLKPSALEAADVATKSYVDTTVAAGAPDASSSTKGILQLTGDLSGTAASPTVPGLASKEPTITAGTTTQYYRGDKSWQTLDKIAVGLSNVDNTSDATKNSAAVTLTNKRITKRIATLTDAATVTPDCDDYDGGKLLTLSQATTIANPTGTPTEAQQYVLRIKSASSQTLSFGNQYRGGNDVPLPTSTTGSNQTDYYGFQWNVDDSKWDIIAIARGY